MGRRGQPAEAVEDHRRRGEGPGPEGERQRPGGGAPAADEGEPEEGGADPGEHQDGGLREPDRDRAGRSEGQAAPHRRPAARQLERQPGEGERHRQVGRVLLHLGAIEDEGRGGGEERRPQDEAGAGEDMAGHGDEERQRGEPAEEGEEAEGVFARSEGHDGELLDEEESPRRHLAEGERPAEQVRQRAVDDVARQRQLVEPEGGVPQVLPEAKDRPQGDAGQKERVRAPVEAGGRQGAGSHGQLDPHLSRPAARRAAHCPGSARAKDAPGKTQETCRALQRRQGTGRRAQLRCAAWRSTGSVPCSPL